MKRALFILVIVFLYPGIDDHKLFAQWNLTNFVPDTLYELSSLDMVSDNEGYIISTNNNDFESTLYHTSDGWNTWDSTHFNVLLSTLDFVSPDTGFLAGYNNAFYYTYNGGQNWQNLPSNCFAPYVIFPYDVAFLNGKYGAVAVPGLDMRTKDYGQTWYRDTGLNAGAEYITFKDGIFLAAGGYCSLDTFRVSFQLLPESLGSGHGQGADISGRKVALAIMGQGGYLFNHPYVNFGIMAVADLDTRLCRYYHLFEINSPYCIAYSGNSIYTSGGFWEGSGMTLIGHFIKSPNDGQNWYKQHTNLPDGSISPNTGWLNNICCPSENTCYALFSTQLYKTTNGGGPLIEEIGSYYETQPILSIHEKEMNFIILPMPNPCTTTLTISSIETPFQYNFYNLHGQEVSSGNSTSRELDVAALIPGMYFLKVHDRKGTHAGKVVKVEP